MSYDTYSGTAVLVSKLDARTAQMLDCLERFRDGYTVDFMAVPMDTDYLLRQLGHLGGALKQALRDINAYTAMCAALPAGHGSDVGRAGSEISLPPRQSGQAADQGGADRGG